MHAKLGKGQDARKERLETVSGLTRYRIWHGSGFDKVQGLLDQAQA